MRKLASIQTISALYPINGKDRIVLAQINGWQVIVQKADYKVGDKCIFCEIDSVLPPKEEFEFLKSGNYRIKTMKMGGVISQGICFPLSFLPRREYKVDEDVTELMGITQYVGTMDKEQDAEVINTSKKYPKFLMKYKRFRSLVLPKKQSKGFPSFISKTDESRIENALFYLQNKEPFVATEKIDGQSGTFALQKVKGKHKWSKAKYDFMVCSRNLRKYTKDNSSFWTVAEQYNIKKMLADLIKDNEWVAIQGECIGNGIQGNKYNVENYDLYVFNLIYPKGRVDSVKAKGIMESYGLKFVPIIDENYTLPDTLKELREFVHGKSKLYNTLREGIVFRSKDGKQSFKCVDQSFLLKNGE